MQLLENTKTEMRLFTGVLAPLGDRHLCPRYPDMEDCAIVDGAREAETGERDLKSENESLVASLVVMF